VEQDGSGNWYLDFDGVDDYLATSANFDVENPWSVFFAYTPDGGAGTNRTTVMEVAINSTNGISSGYRASNQFLKAYSRLALEGVLPTQPNGTVSGGGTAVGTWQYTSGLVIGRINGVEDVNESQNLTTETSAGASIRVGLGVVTSQTAEGYRFYGGLMRAAASSTPEVTDTEAYLADLAGVTL
jgi:hypothetical protein